MFKSEILAPVGDMQMLYAAVRCGADAVYLGVKELNARRNAGNFSNRELEQATAYCHARGVKVYLTLNTLVSDKEMQTAQEVIFTACQAGVDALIVQDLGVVSLAKKAAPSMELHASTQMSVNTLEGVKKLADMGFERAVLPREISKKEMEVMAKGSPIELEVFVHGALCMCVSGQCYMSAMLGSRSGNRGLCAQPCRLPFNVAGGTGHDLSLKDLSLLDDLKYMQQLGISSFKIEGRMKRPEYVAAAVTACKNARDGEPNEEEKQRLKKIFSRSGFTDGYFNGKLGRDMFGTRQKQDVEGAAGVLSELERLYDREKPSIDVELALCVLADEAVTLSGRAGKALAFARSDFIPQKAVNKPTDEQMLIKQLSKLGGTPFRLKNVDVELDDGLAVSASVINSLRRSVLNELLEKSEVNTPIKCEKVDYSLPEHKGGELKLYARFENINQVPDNLGGVSVVYLPLFSDEDKLRQISKRVRVGLEIPRCIFGNGQKVAKALEKAEQNGFDLCLAPTLDGVALAEKFGFEIHCGHTMNLFNSLSLESVSELGAGMAFVSAEATLLQIRRLGGNIGRGIVSYGRLPLMITRNCPVKNGTTCDKCKSTGHITDRMGIDFPVRCSNGFSQIYNSRPIYLADRLEEIKNVDAQLLYFTVERAKECEQIIKEYTDGCEAHGEFTRGLYYRGVE